MRSILVSVGVAALIFASATFASAQDSKADAQYNQYINLLRKDLRSGKKQFIAANLTLTDAEAEKFWPVYDKYAAELEKIYTSRLALIVEYADNFEQLTDKQAGSLIERSIDLDESMTKLRQKYVPQFAKVLGGKTEARFFQIDKRLSLLIDLQLASEIPIVEP